MKTTKGFRLHIGFFGKRNAGKSTVVNNIIGQELSIVSSKKGTTTDTNEKSMELLPIGPVTLLDTAGIDDVGDIGLLRVGAAKKTLERCDVIVFVTDNEKLNEKEKKFIEDIKNKNLPAIGVINKEDISEKNIEDVEYIKTSFNTIIKRNAKNKEKFIKDFKEALIKTLPKEQEGVILSDIINKNEICVLVIPIDKEAPKGRIILPQVNVIREMLDNNSISVISNPNNLKQTLNSLKNPPKIVVTDSQSFKEVYKIVPKNIMLTSFSILFARLKGDLKSLYEGAKKIDELKENDRILILESCSHHPIEDDIGRVKIPNLIKKYTEKNLDFEFFAGHDMPKDVEKYSLVVHCGGCMTTRREIINRINYLKEKKISITNYGIAIAKCTGILDRAIKPLIKNI